MRKVWSCLIKHTHLPQSVWGLEVVTYGGDIMIGDSDECQVMVDVILCAGCCQPPSSWQILSGAGVFSSKMYVHAKHVTIVCQG